MLSQTSSNSLRSASLWGGAIAAILVVNSGMLFAAGKAERTRSAERLVREALHREIYGLDQERQQLLQQALEQLPDYAPAKWAQGYVRYQNRWIKAEELHQIRNEDGRLVAYEKMRSKSTDTIKDQLALADWCRKRELLAQERAHLTQVLALDPDHVVARRRLGFRRVNGAWLNSEEIRQEIAKRKEDQEALAKWRPDIESIRDGLSHSSKRKRSKASDRMRAITDISAIPALEVVLSSLNESTATLVVEIVGDMNDYQAALSLARHAVYSPWEEVRQKAAEQLRSRPKDTYVPALLSAMYSPVESEFEIFRGRGGRIMVRHNFTREGQSENQKLDLNTEYRRIGRAGGDRQETASRALFDAASTALDREIAMNQQNRRTKELNDRIMGVLQTAVGQKYSNDPQGWWQWWNRYNEVQMQGEKQTRTISQTRQVAVADRPAISQSLSAPQGRKECLVAGTPVWTAAGAVAIEKVQIGDLVLSQDPVTGELAYKPVLRTTLRPKSRLIVISTGEETIEASKGHPFWVSGNGWVMARDLKPGMQLHGIAGSVHISSVEEGRQEVTHNLIVADFNTYFVGSMKVLNHDFTMREVVNTVVPGLAVK